MPYLKPKEQDVYKRQDVHSAVINDIDCVALKGYDPFDKRFIIKLGRHDDDNSPSFGPVSYTHL